MKPKVYDDDEKIMKKFRKSEAKAAEILKNSKKTSEKMREAFFKLEDTNDGPIAMIFEDIKLMIDLIRDYIHVCVWCQTLFTLSFSHFLHSLFTLDTFYTRYKQIITVLSRNL